MKARLLNSLLDRFYAALENGQINVAKSVKKKAISTFGHRVEHMFDMQIFDADETIIEPDELDLNL